MDVNVTCSPAYAMAYCYLTVGEQVRVESGAMTCMSDGVGVSASASGGIMKSVMRKVAGGETFFKGIYTAQAEGAWIAVAPRYPGDVAHLKLDGSETFILEQGSYLASTAGVDISVVPGNTTSVFMKAGLTMLKMQGQGDLIVCSYGGLQQFDLKPGQSVIVDTGHLVGFSSTVDTEIGPIAGLTTSAISGEGLAMRATGPGSVWMQTRAEQEFRSWMFPDKKQNK